jgi:glycosyltransferase involved in cell wall biosynthesis
MTPSPRRFLYIAHGFPPAAGSGAQRALAFARYLPEHGWVPIVLTPGVAWASPRDDRLLAEVPPGLPVVRTRSWEPRPRPPTASASTRTSPPQASRLRAQLGHLRRTPDAHRGWLPFAVAAGLAVCRRHQPELLYSTAGPFTSHLVGLILHRLTGRPWIAELRDGWYRWNQAIFPDYPIWRGALECRLEGAVVRRSARLVLVTRQMAEAFRRQYPDLPPDHFAVIPNGFDPAQLSEPTPPQTCAERFAAVYAGALYRGRGVRPLLEAAATLAQQEPAFGAAFRLTIYGTQDEAARAELAGYPEQARLGGYLDHPSALAALRSADLLVLLVNTTAGAAAAVPAKLYEYLAVGRPILAVAPPGAEAAAIIAEAAAGWVAAPTADAIVPALRAAWLAHRTGRRPSRRAEVVARYDRRLIAADLARLLEAVAGQPSRLRLR